MPTAGWASSPASPFPRRSSSAGRSTLRPHAAEPPSATSAQRGKVSTIVVHVGRHRSSHAGYGLWPYAYGKVRDAATRRVRGEYRGVSKSQKSQPGFMLAAEPHYKTVLHRVLHTFLSSPPCACSIVHALSQIFRRAVASRHQLADVTTCNPQRPTHRRRLPTQRQLQGGTAYKAYRAPLDVEPTSRPHRYLGLGL